MVDRTKRVLLAGLFHETHTFLEGTTGLSEFEISRGDELLNRRDDASPMGGFLEVADECGWTVIPSVDYRAAPGPTVDDAVITQFWEEFQAHARPALMAGLDAIYLVLHGAMATRSIADVEGELLFRIRQLDRAARLPIFGVYDLHANFTWEMTCGAECLVAYRENPHTDARDAAVRAARLLQRRFETGQRTRAIWMPADIVWPPTGVATAAEPMQTLQSAARRIEAEHADIWAVNVNAGYAFADTPQTGVSFGAVIEHHDGDPPMPSALAHLEQLKNLAHERRADGNVTERPINEVLDQIEPSAPGLTAIIEPSDNIGGGAPGDGTGVLRAFVERGFQNAAVAINDPDAVQALAELKPGDRTTVAIGGKGSRLDAGPLELEVEFVSRSDGRFKLENPRSHLASMSGDTFHMGPTAVARHEGITLLLTSRKTPPFDLGQWRSQGIDPAQFSFIGVKAAVAHRTAYDPIVARSYWVDTPGPCASNLKSLPFKRIRRPVFPLDER
jgi:microcystin degradation protein MlrC